MSSRFKAKRPQDAQKAPRDLAPLLDVWVPYTTIAGRMVELQPFTRKVAIRLAEASKNQTQEGSALTIGHIVRDHMRDAQTKEVLTRAVYEADVAPNEELDLLMGIRIATYGARIEIAYSCPFCNPAKPTNYPIKMSLFPRYLTYDVEVGGVASECNKALDEYLGPDKYRPEYDALAWSREHWPAVFQNPKYVKPSQADRFMWSVVDDMPQDIELPDALMDLRLTLSRPNVAGQLKALRAEPFRMESVLVASSIRRIEWPSQNIDTDDSLRIAQTFDAIAEKCPSITSALSLFLGDSQGGWDTQVSIRCANAACQKVSTTNLPLDPAFFQPQKAR